MGRLRTLCFILTGLGVRGTDYDTKKDVGKFRILVLINHESFYLYTFNFLLEPVSKLEIFRSGEAGAFRKAEFTR